QGHTIPPFSSLRFERALTRDSIAWRGAFPLGEHPPAPPLAVDDPYRALLRPPPPFSRRYPGTHPRQQRAAAPKRGEPFRKVAPPSVGCLPKNGGALDGSPCKTAQGNARKERSTRSATADHEAEGEGFE